VVRNITFAAFMDLDWFRALVDPNRECRLAYPRAGFEGHYGVLIISRQDFAGVVAGDPIATEITARLKTLAKQLNVDGARAILGGAGRSRRACSPRGEGALM